MERKLIATAEYVGPDRRVKARRIQSDRRGQLRWDPQKRDRRDGFGRRKDDYNETELARGVV